MDFPGLEDLNRPTASRTALPPARSHAFLTRPLIFGRKSFWAQMLPSSAGSLLHVRAPPRRFRVLFVPLQRHSSPVHHMETQIFVVARRPPPPGVARPALAFLCAFSPHKSLPAGCSSSRALSETTPRSELPLSSCLLTVLSDSPADAFST